MNDRFKFRIFHKLENEMNYRVIAGSNNPCSLEYCKNWLGSGEARWVNSLIDGHNILMQCTGLKDKNGKLIYEGDILSLNWFNTRMRCLITYSEEDCACIIKYFGHNSIDLISSLPPIRDREVIGNKFENPELLNG